ncbi:hypothetical protein BGP89_04370 [Luteimonas sp. JM171]|uniref:hypothetical protein n=1 Tax=Luteimonas sp. JM171 TaxID=1896164 RepID=UPI001F48C349|nr:hypothetical protein [Luteimonas sp. JM171]
MMMRRTGPLACLILMAALLLAACASNNRQSELERMQYMYSAAVRWGDFEGAWNLVDPAYREQHPMSDLEFKRYEQVRISGYRELASQAISDDTALREIEIGVINRHNMAERTLRYTEQWRYDPEAGQWWISGGLPDLWAGE